MRTLHYLAIASLFACGGEPPAAAPVVPPPTPPQPSATASANDVPPLPAEPSGLVELTAPTKVCEITGIVKDSPIDLSGRADGSPFVRLWSGKVKLTIGQGGAAFAEAASPTLSLRGIVAQRSSFLHPARWISFGGVFFLSSSSALAISDAHDGKVVVAAPDVAGFTFADDKRTQEISCDDAALATDSTGTLSHDVPPIFAAKGATHKMVLKAKVPIPISAEQAGPVVGTFSASDSPATVVVNEQRGMRARIRSGHIAGWVDASLLVKPKALSAKDAAIARAAQFGMIGLVSPAQNKTEDAGTAVVCTGDVRVVAELGHDATSERYVVGAIKAGSPVFIADKGADLAYLASAGSSVTVQSPARLAVPVKDLVGCERSATKAPASTTAQVSPASKRDAIDNLDGPASADDTAVLGALAGGSGSMVGSSFGAGGLGLSGTGVGGGGTGEGIGLGNIGTLGAGGYGHGGSSPNGAVSLRQGATQVNGRLPPEVIQRVVRQNFGRFRLCYENGLRSNPTLSGRVATKFVIDTGGHVSVAADGGSDLPDQAVVGCVIRGFSSLVFPQPEGGIVTVVYPIIFDVTPPSSPAPAPKK